MILLALALASQGIPAAYWSDVCLERDNPEACAREYRRERRFDRIVMRVCGPDGSVSWDNYPRGKPDCKRNGWDGRRYRQREQK